MVSCLFHGHASKIVPRAPLEPINDVPPPGLLKWVVAPECLLTVCVDFQLLVVAKAVHQIDVSLEVQSHLTIIHIGIPLAGLTWLAA